MRFGRRVALGCSGTTVVLAAVFLAVGQASAQTTDWALSPGGVYTSGGSGSVLVGSNIPTVSVSGDGTPDKNGATLSIVDGVLDFTSGSYDGNGSDWSWGPGGTLSLSGCIAGVTATTCTGSNNVTLISDDFQSVQIESIAGALDVVFGDITGTINAQVAAYFGVSTNFEVASFMSAIVASGTPGKSLTGTNGLGVIAADPGGPGGPSTGVPEEWTLVDSIAFFVVALLVFAVLLRFQVLRLASTR